MAFGSQRAKNTRVSENGLYEPKPYQDVHLYVFDDLDPKAPKSQPKVVLGQAKVHPHKYNLSLIHEFASKHTDWIVHPVWFEKGTRAERVADYWAGELKSKTKRDLVIVYYHGSAGGEEEDYTWNFLGYPRKPIDAYEIIDIANKSKADCLIILDCNLHDRITNKWQRENGSGVTEIMIRPELMNGRDGKVSEHDSDFTEAIFSNLEIFMHKFDDDDDEDEDDDNKMRRQYKMTTIPKIMSTDRNMYSNPRRIWLSRNNFGSTAVVRRIKIDPNQARDKKKLVFVSVQTQGAKEAEEDEEEAEEVEGVDSVIGPLEESSKVEEKTPDSSAPSTSGDVDGSADSGFGGSFAEGSSLFMGT